MGTNYFIFPGVEGDRDYSSAVKIQYGSVQEFNWTTNYTAGLNIWLGQAGEAANPHGETLASTVPLHLLPVYPKAES